MDLTCYRCNSRDLMFRGDFIGCNTCSYWLEHERYGSEALPLLKKQLKQRQQQRQNRLSSTTTVSPEETSRLERLLHKQSMQRANRRRGTFQDPHGP